MKLIECEECRYFLVCNTASKADCPKIIQVKGNRMFGDFEGGERLCC